MHDVQLVYIFRVGKLTLKTMIVYQGEVENEEKLDSNLETKSDEKPLEEEENENIKESIPENISIAVNPIKPVTPVTFPESGTESEVCLYTHNFLSQHCMYQVVSYLLIHMHVLIYVVSRILI